MMKSIKYNFNDTEYSINVTVGITVRDLKKEITKKHEDLPFKFELKFGMIIMANECDVVRKLESMNQFSGMRNVVFKITDIGKLECYICENACLEKVELFQLHCDHTFCWKCIFDHIEKNLSVKVKCFKCNKNMRDSELRQIMTEELTAKYEALCLNPINFSKRSKEKLITCLMDACDYKIWIDSDIKFECPKCGLYNCTKCRAPHRFASCEQYQSNTNEYNDICKNERLKATQKLEKLRIEKNQKYISDIEKIDLWRNYKPTECISCLKSMAKKSCFTLRSGEDICKPCLVNHINSATDIPIKSPNDCGVILESEIKSILKTNDMEVYLKNCIDQMSSSLPEGARLFNCKDGDCGYQCILMPSSDDVNQNKPFESFKCRKCQTLYCLRCNQSHSTNKTCYDYAASIKNTPHGKQLYIIEEKIKKKEMMRCVNCFNLITKASGCNWIRCNVCKLELCWILQMRRWGPKGRGDNSGGCKCGVNGKPCCKECTATCAPHNDFGSLSRLLLLRDLFGTGN